MQKQSLLMDTGPPLPLSSLRLLVSPLRLVSAALWQIVLRRDVMDYGLVEEFVTTVLEEAPDKMSYRERVQLVMGLRAQISDPEVEASESTFLKLVQTLLEDPVEKEHFFQNVFAEKFGPKYDSALQALLWEFLSRLDTTLPSPSLQQTASWFLPDPAVLEECVQCVCHPQPLKNILQHHRHDNTSVHVGSAQLSGDDRIFSPTSLSPSEAVDAVFDPEIQSEPMQGCMSPVSSDNEAGMAPVLDYTERKTFSVNEEAKPAFSDVLFIHEKEENVKHKELAKGRKMNRTKVGKKNKAFHNLQIDRGLKIHAKPHNRKQEILLPVSEVSLGRKSRRVRSHGKTDQVVSQRSQRNVKNKAYDGHHQNPLAPDPSPATGRSKKSKRVKVCSLCRKSFSQAKDLTAHMRSHTEQSPCRCAHCGKDFELQKDLQKHQQNVCEKSTQHKDNVSTLSCEEDDTPATSAGHDQSEAARPPGTLPQSKRGPYVRHATKAFQPSKARQVCYVCDKTLCNLFMLRRHIKSVHGLLPYMCHNCEESFGNNPDLKTHVKECVKLKKRQTCSLCGVNFMPTQPTEHPRGKQQTLNAVKEHVLGAPQPSSSAPQNTTSLNALPVMTPSSSNYKTCLLCNETFDTVANMRKHLKFHHDVHPYPCIHCGESFPNVSDLQTHKCSGQNIPDSRKCPGCRKRTSQSGPQQLKTVEGENLTREQPSGPLVGCGNDTELNSTDICSNDLSPHHTYKCEEVNVPIGQQDQSKEADPNHHPEQADPLDGSSSLVERESGTPQTSSESTQNQTTSDVPPTDKTFCDRASLLLNVQRHSPGQGKHTCSICSRSFSQALFLIRHQARKTGCGPMRRNRVAHENVPTDAVPVFSCPHCQEWFRSKGKLETHMVCHTGEGFDCRFCGKTFTEQYKLYTHVRSHVYRPHLCDSCGKDFRTKYALTVHMRVHTGERPFSCPNCGKSCSSKGNLKAHQRVHSGERPFACTFCKVRCRIKSQLKIHMLTHTGERPHKCLACGKTFQLKFLLRKHLLASCS
ncbi:zinc finger protein 658B-like isoform X2 [Esox lucius]|uniref:C2H2-type domain-containing protein n=1 Tax=Esox lucius TaxID=8010 RepID=A0A6Q2Y8W6_ESOLU|nr:zinc finger protein 658B-like isoform X2 [Esox lucius]